MDRLAIISRVVAGTASDSERQEVEKWINASDENKAEFRNLMLLWTTVNHGQVGNRPDDFRKIKERYYSRTRRRSEALYLVFFGLLFSVLAGLIFYLTMSGDAKQLSFDKVPLRDAIAIVEKKYGIKVEIENREALNCQFTGSFNNYENGYEVIRAIGLALKFECQVVDENRYRLLGSGCGSGDKLKAIKSRP